MCFLKLTIILINIKKLEMEIWEIIETLQLAVEEENWDLVNTSIRNLEDIDPDKDRMEEYFQDDEY